MSHLRSLCLVVAAVAILVPREARSQTVEGNCSFFMPPNIHPNDTVIERLGNACLDCKYETRAPRWQFELVNDEEFSTIEQGNEPPECDCSIDAGRLCFTNFDESAVNRYRCLVQLPLSANSVQCIFKVMLPTPPLINSATLSNITSSVGGTVILELMSDFGNPAGTISWMKGGTPVNTDDRVIIRPDGSLEISSLVADDRGLYEVSITNVAGTVFAGYRVFVNFISIDTNFYEENDPGGFRVECIALAWPEEITVVWRNVNLASPVTATDGTKTPGTYDVRVESTIMFDSTSKCAASYQCTVLNGVGIEVLSVVDACSLGSLVITSLTQVNFTAIRVSWVSVQSQKYFVAYREFSTNGGRDYTQVLFGTASNADSSLVIGGLNPGQSYEFKVRIEMLGGSVPTYQDGPVQMHECLTSFSNQITNVRAQIVDFERRIQLTWAQSTEPDVHGYRVYRDPCDSLSSSCLFLTSGRETTYNFPTSVCDNTEYSFTVQSLNECGGGGPLSAAVSTGCASAIGPLSSVTPADTAITVTWILDSDGGSVIISVNEVEVTSSTKTQRNYTVGGTGSGSACLQDLDPQTQYEVCLYQSGQKMECKFVTTLGATTSTYPPSCLRPSATTEVLVQSGAPPTPTPGTIEIWHIVVIVVGVLAIVAMVFCLVGLCFACQTSKQKVDFGSTSSLQTNSIRDGYPMSNQRSMSPTRSCLSYHTKGHSTNWSDHVDTLRQMETDKGTHV